METNKNHIHIAQYLYINAPFFINYLTNIYYLKKLVIAQDNGVVISINYACMPKFLATTKCGSNLSFNGLSLNGITETVYCCDINNCNSAKNMIFNYFWIFVIIIRTFL